MMNLSWSRVVSHANKSIEDGRTALETARADQIPALQARISAWREVLDLPTTLESADDSAAISTYHA
jgi:hypothetical protein